MSPLTVWSVEADVENRVHHAGHGDARPGADRDQKRVRGVAELGAHDLFQLLEGLLHRPLEAGGVLASVLLKVGADLGGDGEASRHRNAQVGHLGQVGSLAAQELLHVGGTLRLAGPKEIDVLFRSHLCSSWALWASPAPHPGEPPFRGHAPRGALLGQPAFRTIFFPVGPQISHCPRGHRSQAQLIARFLSRLRRQAQYQPVCPAWRTGNFQVRPASREPRRARTSSGRGQTRPAWSTAAWTV